MKTVLCFEGEEYELTEAPDEGAMTRNQIMRRKCERFPGLYAFCNLGVRHSIVCDPNFPYKSTYAYRVLNGDALDDDRGGSYHVRRSQVVRVAASYGLRVVTFEGTRYWSDDVRVP